mgnify:FL=1
MKIRLWEIYKVFVKIGMILIGGGYVILPILKDEIIKSRNWITEDELVDYYAISQSLPGLIAANISIFIGYKLRGKLGAIMATLGMITAPFLCIIAIASIVSKISQMPTIKGILWGVGFGVIILIISSVKEMWSKSITDKFSFGIFCLFLIAILKWNIAPAPIIISSMIIGIAYQFVKFKIGENK